MRPSCNLEHNGTTTPTLPVDGFPNAPSTPPLAPVKAMWDYEVAELAWENGQLVTHGFGFPRTVGQPSTTKYAWDNPRVGDTLEAIVNQATCPRPPSYGAGEHLPLFCHDNATVDADMEALVASSNVPLPPSTGENPARLCLPGIGSSTACSGAVFGGAATKCTLTSKEMSGRSESWHVTMENTCDIDLEAGFTWASHTSLGRPVLGQSMPTTLDDHDSVGCRPQAQARAQVNMKRESTEENGNEDGKKKAKMEISSVSTKRSRARAAAAAVHNQSERRRRDKINQRMETLQKLIPNFRKTDKASVLDEVIVYLKQLQAQLQMMSSFPHMMVPMTTTMQQLQMSMLAQMGMGMGMSAMDINSMNRLGSAAAVPPMLHQGILLPLPASWDGSVDRLPPSAGAVLPDLFSTFLSRQTMPPQQQQPMTLDAYNRMMALYQQPHPRTAPGGNTEGLI